MIQQLNIPNESVPKFLSDAVSIACWDLTGGTTKHMLYNHIVSMAFSCSCTALTRLEWRKAQPTSRLTPMGIQIIRQANTRYRAAHVQHQDFV